MRVCDFKFPDGTTCKKEFKTADAVQQRSRHRALHFKSFATHRSGLPVPTGVATCPGLEVLAAAATIHAAPEPPNINNHSDQQPDPPPRSIDSSMNRSLADLPTKDPFMEVVGVPPPGTKAYLCVEHIPTGGGKAEPGCYAFVVPFADPDGYYACPNDQIRAFAPSKSATAVAKHSQELSSILTLLWTRLNDSAM